jgi:hypothetical protein
MRVRAKGRQQTWMPIPADVGMAIFCSIWCIFFSNGLD